MLSAAASSSTPRERRSAERMRSLAERVPLSPIGRVEMDRAGVAATVTPDEEEEDDSESPSPRAKRPRMLDFNMAATPIHTSSGSSVLGQVHTLMICVFNEKYLLKCCAGVTGSKVRSIWTFQHVWQSIKLTTS